MLSTVKHEFHINKNKYFLIPFISLYVWKCLLPATKTITKTKTLGTKLTMAMMSNTLPCLQLSAPNDNNMTATLNDVDFSDTGSTLFRTEASVAAST